MIRINQIKIYNDLNTVRTKEELFDMLYQKASKLLRIDRSEIKSLEIIRHSIDARKKPEIYDVYMIDISLRSGSEESKVKRCKDKNVSIVSPAKYDFDKMKKAAAARISGNVSLDDGRIVVIGSGPAGMFCAYMLAQAGLKPLVIERGSDIDKRMQAVEAFWNGEELDEHTNVQFGEGGAGTFSDGKLNTMVKDKDGRGREALSIFTLHGANEDIMYEAKPHIGTDILCKVIKSMRERIISNGGEFVFDTKVTELVFDKDSKLSSVIVSGDKNEEIKCCCAVLAIGHSARDTFYMLKDKKVSMEPKPFAVGFRVEHPQSIINLSQYGVSDPKTLPASPYKLVMNTDNGRGVYSFCMCPGGYVVNASSEKGRLAVNGMSYSARDSRNANSAIIMTVSPNDFGGDDVLSGVEFQRRLEEKAYEIGGGKIPLEYYGDFKKAVTDGDSSFDGASFKGDINNELIKELDQKNNLPCMKGAYSFSNVHEILPVGLNKDFVQGMEKFGRMIKGYNSDGALISGVESRTSSPVRILRGEDGVSINIKGLYPCGEGAGYAGGIMSAAMDGIKTAELIAASLI
ncbi:FAD-binding protein [Butyrivibrio sp. X503]|uniref:NAD(P)/FAD-dependent oxidoreductase n=1 Tax=Butyrivibrio sp. X503 TaxID=2364878 RepID=UPI000EA8B53E|nr:NAD(P)/FAD-dependent oxidoreductase [Butyrivibrio sp. X503]RKM57283.1 FAD-binding protein [Butyrivibrio sp. X503]